jgi:predicted nucleic acid-binding Zn ribbon protein
MSDKFWCTECGTKRDVLDAVTEIKDGAGLCRYCNQQLEAELGSGVREYVPKRTSRV